MDMLVILSQDFIAMNLSLSEKNALVGGSSKGIGKAIAFELAALGANVTLMARTEELLKALQWELQTAYPDQRFDYIAVDFNDRDALAENVQALLTRHPIHILINNTGGPPGGPITEASTAAFTQALSNHLLCNHLLAQAVIPGMKADGYGRIINITSTSTKEPIDGLGVSNTTRGAVASWAKTLAGEVGPFGITVNNILPGFTDTDRLRSLLASWAQARNLSPQEMEAAMKERVPLKRFARPEEVAQAAAFLASPAGSYITGTSMLVDGGRTKALS